MHRSNNLAHFFNYLDEKTVEQLCNTSKLATNVSRGVRRIPGVADKRIKIKDVDAWIKRFPGLIHINIKGYGERINNYIYLFRQNMIKRDLSYCRGVTDVSALGGVHTLNLRGCSGVTDVSALGGVHTLDLSHCANVTDVSALGGVHTLDLSHTNVTDVSALGGVHTLNLSHCYRITDVSALGGVHTLDLYDCTNITDVSALGGVHTLNLSGCKGVTDLSMLTNVKIIR
jgi:hypothetical protein